MTKPRTRDGGELLALGADPNTKNQKGETALTWAMRRGYTPVVEVLKRAGRRRYGNGEAVGGEGDCAVGEERSGVREGLGVFFVP